MTITTLAAPDALSLRSIADFADTVRGALDGTHDVAIDLSAVAAPDLSVVQLVEAARRQAVRQGLALTLAHPAAGPLAALLDRAGFADLAPADHHFWFHGAAHQ